MKRHHQAHRTVRRALAWGALGLAALLLGGCGDGNKGGGGTADRCVRNLERILAKERCQWDDHCPCGSHCVLGQCQADCIADIQCGGGRCDSLGRCREAADPATMPQLAPRTVGDLSTVPSSLIAEDGEPQELRVVAARQALPRVRLVADPGLLVRCDEASTFKPECEIGPVFPGAARTVHVVENAPLPTGETRLVRLYTGTTLLQVSFTAPASFDAMTARKTIEATVLAGTYEGYALARTAEITSDAEEGTAAHALTYAPRLALTASIYMAPGETSGVIVLSETFGVLGTAGDWTGTVQLGEKTGTVRFATFKLLGGPLTGDESVEVLTEGEGTLHWSVGARTALSIILTTRMRGVLPGDLAPRTQWFVTLSRKGDLPAGAPTPTVPADATPALDPSRGSTPLRWEEAAQRTLPGVGAVWSDVPTGVVDTFRLQHSAAPYLEACRDDVVAHEAAGRTFFLEQLNDKQTTRQAVGTQTALAADPSPLVVYLAGAVPEFQGDLTVTATTSVPWQAWPVASDPATSVDRAIPCEVELLPPAQYAVFAPDPRSRRKQCGDAGGAFALPAGTVDRCVEMQAAYGCEPVEVQDPDAAGTFVLTPRITGSGMFTLGSEVCTWTCDFPSPEIRGRVRRVCRLPSTPARCVDAALCVEPGAGNDHASLPTSNLGASVAYISGDSLCADTGRGVALPLDVNADLPLTDEGRLNAEGLLTACLEDLEALRTSSPTLPAQGSGGAGLSQTLGDSMQCLDPGRFFLALGLATEEARGQLLMPGPNGERAGAQAHRLLQRYVQIVGFQAREVVEQERLGQVIRALGDASMPDPAEVLQNSLDGWNLLLHPRFAAALAALPGAVLAAPDYRTRLGVGNPTIQPHHEQYDSLAIAIQETLRAQMELAEILVERSARAGDQGVLDSVGALIRVRLALLPIVTDLVARAKAHTQATGAPAPSWLMRYERARGSAEAAEARMITAADALSSGRNPLGIEESDLPLYFHGTQPDAEGRFFSISDYLLGSGPGSTAWAPAQVQEAQDALDAARTAWLAQRQRALDVQLEVDARALRETRIAESAGEELIELCGDHLWADIQTGQILDETETLNTDGCFMKSDVECQASSTDYSNLWKKGDVKLQLCQAGLRAAETTAITGESTEWTKTDMDTAHPGISDYDFMLLTLLKRNADDSVKTPPELICTGGEIRACGDGTGRRCYTCTISRYKLYYRYLTREDFRRFFPGAGDLEYRRGYKEIRDAHLKLPLDIGTLRVSSQGSYHQSTQDKNTKTCKKTYKGSPTPPTLAELPANPADNPSCYDGSLGELALSVQAAVKAAEQARAELGSYTESYDIAMRSCIRLQQGNDFIQRATLEHDAHMSRMRGFKLGFDIVARAARGVKESMDLATAGAGGAAFSFGTAAGTATAGMAAAAVETVADIASLSLDMAMEQTEQDHERVVAEMEMNTELDRCVIEAELNLVGARAATFNFQSAVIDLERAVVELQNAKNRAARVFTEGKGDLAQLRTTPLRRTANDFWLDEAVGTFTREMRLARRVSYLAVRAVEYETQQSLSTRGDVLEAEIPDELDAAIDDLMTITGTRQLNGSMPSNLKTVVSFRRHLLQLADRSGAEEGDPTPTEEERLQLLLVDPRYQTFDDQGVYLGQLIPFRLAPLGTLGLGGDEGAYVFAANDCAERVWSVNASIHGEAGLFEGDDPSFVRLDLLKRNTFYSQWCVPPSGDADPFQVASVRPSRNLFREPGLGPVPGTRSVAVTDEYTRGRIEAYFNVPRDEFERDEYANGETSELAGRGLYGDYALFIPSGVLSKEGEGGVPTTGLRLDKVTDILIRLDYVSVARN